MKPQLDLFPSSRVSATPAPDSAEPRLWVRRLVLWSKSGQVCREVSLRPGLNIIWSPDPAEAEADREPSVSLGHGSGKTLFCRLLRYCLGEDRFAPEIQRGDIGRRFPEGLVGAEMRVDGVTWNVVRPIGHRRKHLAVAGLSLEELLASDAPSTGTEPLVEAITTAILTPGVASIMPEGAKERAWLAALALLARDQECRFDHVLDWRSAASDSDSPVRTLSRTETLDVLRAFIGAVDPTELALRAEVAVLEKRRKDATDEARHRAWDAARGRSRLVKALGLQDEDLLPGRFATESLRKAAGANLARAAKITSLGEAADLRQHRAEREELRNRIAVIVREIARTEGAIEPTKSLLAKISAELPGASGAVHSAEVPPCPVCEVPIDRVLAEGCKLSHKLPNLDEARARRDQVLEEKATVSKDLDEFKKRLPELGRELADLEVKAKNIDKLVSDLERAQEERTTDWYEARRLGDDVGRFDDALRQHERALGDAESSDKLIEEARERRAALRGLQAELFGRLSRHFDTVVRELAGEGAEGRADLTGKGLELRVLMGGNRSTPAIDSLKVIAFDIAVLLLSIEGKTHLPAFLVHDSPREADLGLSPYYRLFQLAKRLEQIGSQPLFQYIVTTTTRPPNDVLCEPWHRLTLHGAPPEERLLREDL